MKPSTKISRRAMAAKSTAELRRDLERSQAKSRAALRALGLSDTEISAQVAELNRGVPIETLVKRFMTAQRAKREGRAAEHAALARRMGVVPQPMTGIVETATSLKLGAPLGAPDRDHDREALARRMGCARDAPAVVSTPYRLELRPPPSRARTERADMRERLDLQLGDIAPDDSGRLN